MGVRYDPERVGELLDVFGKLFMKVIQKRFQVVEEVVSDSQCDFRKGRGCTDMVHVTSYLNFAAGIRGLPSQNSVNAREIFRRASAPALQTGHGNVPTAEHFPWNTVVSRRRRDCLYPPGESGLAKRD